MAKGFKNFLSEYAKNVQLSQNVAKQILGEYDVFLIDKVISGTVYLIRNSEVQEMLHEFLLQIHRDIHVRLNEKQYIFGVDQVVLTLCNSNVSKNALQSHMRSLIKRSPITLDTIGKLRTAVDMVTAQQMKTKSNQDFLAFMYDHYYGGQGTFLHTIARSGIKISY